MRVEININEYVLVHLTERGHAILRENQKKVAPNLKYVEPRRISDGWYEMQLHQVMTEFGEHLYNGCDVPFETTIRLEKPV